MILLSKFGFNAEQVWHLPVLEVASWVDAYSQSLRVKPKAEMKKPIDSGGVIYSMRKKRE